MATFDASTAELLVFTFKEGLLSAVAHDLKLRVTRFTAQVSETAVTVEVDAGSLTVLGAMKDGQDYPSGLPSVAFGEIDRTVATAVLDSKRYPTIRFASTAIAPGSISGTLTLKGKSGVITGERTETATHHEAQFRIDQREFGMKPYTAMLGTMKVGPHVIVRARIPRAAR